MNYIKDIPYKVSESVIDGIENKGTLYNAVVEISNDENVKYEIHPSGEYLTAVRALNPIFRYPFSYGYIPQTLAEDGDGLDVIIVTPEPLAHLSVMEVRVLGYVPTVDNGEVDDKIIAVPAYSKLKKVSMDKIMAFLKNYKYPENASTQVSEFVASIASAEELIEQAHKAYEVVNSEVAAVIPSVQQETPSEPSVAEIEPSVNNLSQVNALPAVDPKDAMVADPAPEAPNANITAKEALKKIAEVLDDSGWLT